jgi:RHS repeat-associated protein
LSLNGPTFYITFYVQDGGGSATYTAYSAAATPTFSPVAGTYTSWQTVTISDTTSGATIYYTTNGTTPTTSSTIYTSPITVSSSETLKAISTANYYTTSAVGTAAYTINLAAQTITFPTIPAQTVGTPLTLSATASSGLAVGFASTTTSICTVSGTTATFIASGTCTIQATQAGNNAYAAAPLVSQCFTVNGKPQTITFTAPTTPVIYGVAPITLSATASSGLAVSFSVTSGPATVSGSTLTITGAGTVVVAANQVGNANYAAATQVTQSVTVNKATLTVTAASASRAYGAANPTFTDTITGFVNGDTSSVVSGAPSLTTTATSTSAVGSYTITASTGTLAATNYSFNYVNGTLTVTSATQTITFTAPTSPVTYGVSPITLSATASSGLAVSFSVTSGPATVSGSTLTITGAGTVVVAANQVGNANYAAATQVTQSVTVNKATLTVTANNISRAYGAANPTFTDTITGFVNGDTSSVVSGAPSLTTTATASSPVGSYTITAAAGTLAATNYSFTYVNGTLTVSQATLTVTANNTSRAYGTANPTFTDTITGFVNGDTTSVVSGSASLTTTATTSSPAGSYIITAAAGTLAATNYSFTYVNGTLTVTAATQTINFTAPTSPVTYGVAPITLSATASSSLAVTFSVTSGPASVSGSTLTITGGGTVVVAANQAGNANYAAAAQVTQSIVVNPATLTVTANSASRAYGSANPTFTDTITGFINGDTAATATSGAASLTTTANSSSAVGMYTITAAAGTLAATNYSFTYVNATLTVTPGAGIITTMAGSGAYGIDTGSYTGDYGPATSATLNMPEGMVVDAAGNLYFSDFINDVVRKVAVNTGVITTAAGNGTLGYSGDGGLATSAELSSPGGLAVDASGNLYIADLGNGVVRKVTFNSSGIGTITTVAGSGASDFILGLGGPATSASLSGIVSVAVDTSGNIYIADDGLILQVAASTGNINLLAGTLTTGTTISGEVVSWGTCGGNSGDGGPISSAGICTNSITFDPSGNLYIDSGSIRKVTASNGVISPASIITTVAGNGTGGYSGDGGPATSAEIDAGSVAVDAAGNLYILDTVNQVVRKVYADNGIIVTVAGNGTAGFSGDGGLAVNAELDTTAGGVAVNSSGTMFYITDAENNRIRAVGSAPTTPIITWPPFAAINYGTPLSAAQLDATSNIAGPMTYTPALGTILPAGTQTLSVTVNPTDTADFTSATATAQLTVNQVTPVITWATPTAIPYGTALSATQFIAAASGVNGVSLPGKFTPAPPLGTVLTAEPHTLTVTFAPADSIDYTPAVAQVTEIVTPVSGTTPDTGTVTLSVNPGSGYVTAAFYNYGANDTSSSVAEGLAGNVASSSPVKITAVDDAVYIEATATGSASNYPYALSAWNGNSLLYPAPPSFVSNSIGGQLDGGAAAQTTGQGVTVYSFNGAYDPAGNLLGYTDNLSGGQPNGIMGTWSFNYDSLNRLISGAASTGQYAGQNLCWSYDPFGNRTAQSLQTAACPTLPSAPTPTARYNGNNQVTWTQVNAAVNGFTYDFAGNVVNDNVNQYLYDGDGRICAVASTPMPNMTTMTGYLYDANGTRVAKGTITNWNGGCDPTVNGFQTTNDYILGPGGEQVTEMGVGGTSASGDSVTALTWQHTNIWAGGKLLGTYDGGQNTETINGVQTTVNTYGLHFYFNDPLGTRRAQTNFEGVIEKTCGSLPFGDQETCAPTPTEHLFTGKEYDAESQLDYFGARYYASTIGRFLSPDDGSDQNALSPASWNLFSYVQNNPLTNTDPDGRSISICTIVNGTRHYTDGIDDDVYNAAQQSGANGGLIVPSLEALQNSSAGFGEITDSSGNVVATVQWTSDFPGIQGPGAVQAFGRIGGEGMAGIKWFVEQMAWNVVGGFAAHGIGLGVETLQAARAAKAAEALAVAERVTQHAFTEHVGEFGNITRNEFQSLVQETMANPSEVRSLSNGRTAYWSDSQQMVVIENGTAPSQSTAFRPTGGKAYFNNLR